MRGLFSISPHQPNPEAGGLTLLAKCLALAGGGSGPSQKADALAIAERVNTPARVQNVLKAAVAGHATSDAEMAGLVDARILTTAFVSALSSQSIFYRLLDDGLTRVPLRTRLSYTTANASAFIIGEGAAVPVSRMTLDGILLDPVKACGLIVFTNEMLRSAGNAAEALLTRELRRAVTAVVDAKFFDLIVDDDTPTGVSEGATADDAILDVRKLLGAVQPKADSKLLFAMAPDVARTAATLRDGSGFVFPEVGPLGGQILSIDAMVSDGLLAGTLMLLDGSGIAGESELVTVDASNDTTVEMADAPLNNSVTPTSTTLVSMFQSNSTAVLAKAFFGAERFRDNAVATITGVAWGGPAPTL